MQRLPLASTRCFPPQWVSPTCLLFDLLTPVSRQPNIWGPCCQATVHPTCPSTNTTSQLTWKHPGDSVLRAEPSVLHSNAACGLLYPRKMFFISGTAETTPLLRMWCITSTVNTRAPAAGKAWRMLACVCPSHITLSCLHLLMKHTSTLGFVFPAGLG